MITAGNTDLKEKLLSDFQLLQNNLNGESQLPFNQARKAAIEKFDFLGFPTTKNEEWKYTSILPHLKKEYFQYFKPSAINDSLEINKVLLPKSFPYPRLVFINGFYSKEWSTAKMENCIVTNLMTARKMHPDLIEKYFVSNAESGDAFTSLNLAFAQDGAFIFLPEDFKSESAIHLLWITITEGKNILSHPRHLIIAGENSTANIIQEERVIGTSDSFTNAITELFVGANANVNLFKIQHKAENEIHVETTNIKQQHQSICNVVTVMVSGKFIRNNLNNVFKGENSESHFYGLYVAGGNEFMDNHTLIDHAVPNCFSNEFYKGIIGDEAHGVFNGKILVRKDAQKTNAFQSNRNVLLSDKAVMNSKPQLEIFADDVKCTHGATTGQLDDEAMFYLQSRGLRYENARALLLRAFASDILEKISLEPLRHQLEQYLDERLGKNLF
jgi:Fe-S cluster assembly protein SufD